MPSGMASDSITYRLVLGIPEKKLGTKLKTCYSAIFEDANIAFFENRFKEKHDFISVLAFKDQTLVGFKIGYRYDDITFYSWIGGVLERYRKQGIGQQLFSRLEQELKLHNYSKLRTKSMNRFKAMIVLNIKNNLDIKQVYVNSKRQEKIIFEKYLR